MKELKKYQNRVNAVCKVVNGREAKYLPETVESCIALLKLYEERYGVIY